MMMNIKILHYNKKKFLLLVMVLLLASLSQVLSDIYLPSMPFIALSFGISKHLVQLSLFFFMAGLAASQLFYGPLSDAYGRKYPLIFGLILCVIGSSICLLSPSIVTFNVGRILQGIGAGSGLALSRSVMRDAFSGSELARVSSYFSIANITIMTAAPFLGGGVLTALAHLACKLCISNAIFTDNIVIVDAVISRN